MDVNNVSPCFFYAPSLKPTFAQIWAEDFDLADEHRCGKLLVSKVSGFTTSPSSMFIFHHPNRRIMVFVHIDDVTSTGSGEELKC